MKAVILLVSIILTSTFAATLLERTSINRKREFGVELEDKVRQEDGCKLNLCFAFDGSASITFEAFQDEMYFIVDIVAIALETRSRLQGMKLAAVQYGDSVESVSSLTSDAVQVLTDIFNARYLEDDNTNIAAGINYCSQELLPATGEAVEILLFTDGRATTGEDPVVAANRFRDETGGKIEVVGVGLEDPEVLLGITGGNEKGVFSVEEGIDIFSILDNLEKLFQEKCESLEPLLTPTTDPSFSWP